MPARKFGLLLSATILANALPAQPPAKVFVVPVKKGEHVPKVVILGEARPFRTSLCGAEVAGRIEHVSCVEGLDVTKDDVLVQLDRALTLIRREEARAELDLAQQQLDEHRAGARPEEIREKEQALAEASALESRAADELQRVESLIQSGATTVEDRIRALSSVAAARAVAARRTAELDLVRAGPRKEVIARSESTVRRQAARLSAVEEELRQSAVRAPFDGRIVRKLAGEGAFVRVGDPVIEMVQIDPIRVDLPVPERFVDRVRPGSQLPVTLDAIPGTTFEATIEAIIPNGMASGRTFPVRLLIPNPERRILPGMLARAPVASGDVIVGWSIPRDAVLGTAETGWSTFAIREGLATPVALTVHGLDNAWAIVTGDLMATDSVVVRGNERLFPGQPVVIVTEATGATGR